MTECWKTVREYPRIFHTWLVIGFILGGFILGGIIAAQQTTNPPVMVLSSELITTEVRANDILLLHVYSVSAEYRDCMGQITQEFSHDRVVNGKLVSSKRRIGAPQPIVHTMENEYVIEVSLPDNISPGQWRFQGETIYECGRKYWLWGSATQRYRTGFLPFTVLPATAAR